MSAVVLFTPGRCVATKEHSSCTSSSFNSRSLALTGSLFENFVLIAYTTVLLHINLTKDLDSLS